jgi:hypothetical protein
MCEELGYELKQDVMEALSSSSIQEELMKLMASERIDLLD